MKTLGSLIRRFRRHEGGATAVEYGLITAGISITLIVSLATVGTEVNETFTTIGATLSSGQAN